MSAEGGAIVELAPAKINLALHVTGQRADGYHDIETLAVFTRFGDRLSVAAADSDSFSVSGRYCADTPRDASNLVVRARDALRRNLGEASARPVAIALEKNLPVASGIGGGSSDAAAALRALPKFWSCELDAAELARISAPLGADLPMCLDARPLLARGTGDRLTLVQGFPSLGLVLVNPGVEISTASVFAALSARDGGPLPLLPGRLDFHSLRAWLEASRNDLEAPAFSIAPAIAAVKRALMKADAGFARMSGSGATCFGLFETGNVAKRAAADIRARHPDWFVAATRSMASEDRSS